MKIEYFSQSGGKNFGNTDKFNSRVVSEKVNQDGS